MAGAASRMLKVIFAGDASGLTHTLGEVTAVGEKVKKHFGTSRAAIGKGMAEIGAGAVGIGLALDHIAQPAEQAKKQLEQAVKNAGGDWEKFKGKVSAVDSRMENFAHSNADTNAALAKLTTGLQSPTAAISSMGLVADVAATKHISLADAAGLVVKIHAGSTKAFKEFGMNVAKAADPVKSLAKANDKLTIAGKAVNAATQKLADLEAIQHGKKKLTIADHQHLRDAVLKVTTTSDAYKNALLRVKRAHDNVKTAGDAMKANLKELAARIKGQASASVDSFGGKLDIMKTKALDFAAGIGQKIAPALVTFGPALGAVGLILQSNLLPAIGSAITATWSFTAALLANPIVAVGVVLVALGVAFYEAYQHIDSFKRGIDRIWQALQTGFHAVWDVMKQAWAAVGKPLFDTIATLIGLWLLPIRVAFSFVKDHWRTIWGAVKRTWDVTGAPIFSTIVSVVTVMGVVIKSVFNALGTAIAWAWDHGIKQALAPIIAAFAAVKSAWDDFQTVAVKPTPDQVAAWEAAGHPAHWNNQPALTAAWIKAGRPAHWTPPKVPDAPGHGNIDGPPAPTKGGGRALGGKVRAGVSYFVGERGPEPFVPDVAGTILPYSTMGGGNTTIMVDARGSVGLDESKLGRYLADLITRDARTGGPIKVALNR